MFVSQRKAAPPGATNTERRLTGDREVKSIAELPTISTGVDTRKRALPGATLAWSPWSSAQTRPGWLVRVRRDPGPNAKEIDKYEHEREKRDDQNVSWH
jgi:hypothetical protein